MTCCRSKRSGDWIIAPVNAGGWDDPPIFLSQKAEMGATEQVG